MISLSLSGVKMELVAVYVFYMYIYHSLERGALSACGEILYAILFYFCDLIYKLLFYNIEVPQFTIIGIFDLDSSVNSFDNLCRLFTPKYEYNSV